MPSAAQEAALGKVLDEWVYKFDLSPEVIWPHRHFGKTSCYGAKLHDTWAELVFLRHSFAWRK